jgi:hypothetical protein
VAGHVHRRARGVLPPRRHNRHFFDAFLPPYEQTAALAGMRFLPPLVLHGAHRIDRPRSRRMQPCSPDGCPTPTGRRWPTCPPATPCDRPAPRPPDARAPPRPTPNRADPTWTTQLADHQPGLPGRRRGGGAAGAALGLGAIIGYLGAGIAIGPWGLKLVSDRQAILHFAEFGVVLMLFLVGLELEPRRLWAMRRPIFGWGSAQLLGSRRAGRGGGGRRALALALVAALGLALSSTAIGLVMGERNLLPTNAGQACFASAVPGRGGHPDPGAAAAAGAGAGDARRPTGLAGGGQGASA